MTDSRTKNVLKNTRMGIIARIAKMIVNFALKTLFIHLLGAQYTGLSSLFTDILTFLSFAELGIGSAITYALYKPVAENNEKKIAELLNFYKAAYRIVALIVFVTGIVLMPFLQYIVTDVPDIKEDINLIYFLYVVNTASSYLLIYKSAIFEAKQKRSVLSIIETKVLVIRLLIEGIELALFRQFIIYLITDIVLNLIQNIWIAKKADREYNYKDKTAALSKNERNEIMSNIYALALYQVAFVALSSTDSIIISSMIGTELVGFLSCYKMIYNQIISFLQQFIYGANASVGNLVTEENTEKEYQLFKDLNFAFFVLSCFCCVCLYVLTEPFILIWVGNSFQLGQKVVAVLTIDFFLNVMRQIVSMFRTANGLFVQGKFRPLIMAIINIVLSIVLAKPMGVFGVLAATVISKVLTEVWYDPYIIYKNIFKKSVKEYYWQYLKYSITIVLSCYGAYKLGEIIRIGNIYVNFILAFLICCGLSVIVIAVFWGKTKEFRNCRERVEKIIFPKRI